MQDRSLRRPPFPPYSTAPVMSGSPQAAGHGAPLLREQRPAASQVSAHSDGDGQQGAEGQPAGGNPPGPGGSGDGSGSGDGHGSGSGAGDGSGTGDGAGQDGRGSGDSPAQDDNPFAPPPEGTPDRPWQPRRPDAGGDSGSGGGGGGPWGDHWSDRQPGRSQDGGFGERPRSQNNQDGPQKTGPGPMRWDPTDPAQRRARYALLGGMWAFFFALFGWRDVALLLAALSLYWGISSLRAKSRAAGARAVEAAARPDPAARVTAPPPAPTRFGDGAAPDVDRAYAAKQQTTAAVGGIVTAGLALAMIAATFTAQLVYRDYYTCVNDSLTNSAKQSCDDLLPKNLRPLLGSES